MATRPQWSRIRSEFPVLESTAYLNTGTYGPLPQATLEVLTEAAREELVRGRSSTAYYERIDTLRAKARALIARSVDADVAEIALSASTTTGANVVVAGLRLGAGDEILTTDIEHHAFMSALRAGAATVKIAPVADAPLGDIASVIADAIGPRTHLIALSHVSWMDGRILPIAEIAGHGVPVLVDGAQSVGAMPVSVAALGCDFLCFPGQKWLLGPDATGGVYVSKPWHERLHVALPSYFGHEPWRGQAVDIPRAGATRFDLGPIPLPMLAAFVSSLDFIDGLGEKRFERARELTRTFRRELCRRVEMITPPDQSTLMSFDPGRDSTEVQESLARQGVVVRTVPTTNWIRASVGFWNSEDDLERLLTALG